MEIIKKVNILINNLKNKEILLNSLKDITSRQNRIIQAAKVEMLEELIQKKQLIIRRINRLDSAFLKTFTEIKKKTGVNQFHELNVDPQNLHKLTDLTDSVYKTILEIQQIDQDNTKALKSEINEVKKKIGKVNKGKKVTDNYSKSSISMQRRLLDKKQ